MAVNDPYDYVPGSDYNQDNSTGFCHCGADEFVAPGLAWCPYHRYTETGE
jgi:hypothetical protein